jgi:hypothetical protein
MRAVYVQLTIEHSWKKTDGENQLDKLKGSPSVALGLRPQFIGTVEAPK